MAGDPTVGALGVLALKGLVLLSGPLAVWMIVRGAAGLAHSRSQRRRQLERLFASTGGHPLEGVAESPMATRLGETHSLRRLGERLDKAGLNTSPLTFVGILMMGAAILFVFLWSALAIGPLVNLLISAGIVWAAAGLYLSTKGDSYRRELASQMPQVAILVGNSLKAGLAVEQGIELVATKLGPPASREFGRVAQEVALGEPVETALERLARRFPLDEVKIIATTIQVERQVGGDLSRALAIMSSSIIDRQRVRGEIDALMAEGRITGVAMLVIPFLMLLLVNQTQPGVVRDFLAWPPGIVVLGIFAGIQVFAFRLIDMFSRVEV
jgi:tight adherence protein B